MRQYLEAGVEVNGRTDRQIHMLQTAEWLSAETSAKPFAHRTLRCDTDWLYGCVFQVRSRVVDGSTHTAMSAVGWYEARCVSCYWVLTCCCAGCPFYRVPEHDGCRDGMPRRV